MTPWTLLYEPAAGGKTAFKATRGEEVLAFSVYAAGDENTRRNVAESWAANPLMMGGSFNNAADFEAALRVAESKAVADRADEQDEKQTLSAIVCKLAGDAGVEVWRDPAGNAWATFTVGQHREHWPIRSRTFKRWLGFTYFQAMQKPAPTQSLDDATSVFEANAIFSETASVYPVAVRVAELDGCLYYDLANDDWECVCVDANGWTVVTDPPVRFARHHGMLPIPTPEHGGKITALRELLNIPDADGWTLQVAWAAGAMRATGPYPVLNLDGEQGSGKTTAARMWRALIDPNDCSVRAEPREVLDLVCAANNGHVVAYDNLSKIPLWMSNAICRLSTGGGFGKRELYSDSAETLFTATRPVLINGIGNVVERPDLLERTLNVTLPAIPPSKRKTEAHLWASFNAMRPRLFGALLDAVAGGLRRRGTVTIAEPPRMADFAYWAVAVEPSLGLPSGSVLAAYQRDRAASVGKALEASPVGVALVEFIEAKGAFTGNASALLKAIRETVNDKTANSKDWPKTGKGMSDELHAIAPELRRSFIDVNPPKKSDKKRTWEISLNDEARAAADATAETESVLDYDHDDDVESDAAGAIVGVAGAIEPPDRPDQRPTENAVFDSATAVLGVVGVEGVGSPTSGKLACFGR